MLDHRDQVVFALLLAGALAGLLTFALIIAVALDNAVDRGGAYQAIVLAGTVTAALALLLLLARAKI